MEQVRVKIADLATMIHESMENYKRPDTVDIFEDTYVE